MTRNKVMNLWTAVVTAFLALCTSLGLITTTAVAAVPATEAARNINTPQDATAQEEPIWTRPRASSLPPTMKQRIHAEAHGSSPSCRHRPPTDAMDATDATDAMAADTAVTRDSALAPAPAAVRAVTDATAPAAVTTADAVSAAAPVHPSGITRTTTGTVEAGGTVDTGATNAKPSAGHTDELPTRAAVTAATECVLPAPATPATPATSAALAMDAAPAAVTLPSQSSAPASAPAPAPVQLPAPVLATAGTASQG